MHSFETTRIHFLVEILDLVRTETYHLKILAKALSTRQMDPNEVALKIDIVLTPSTIPCVNPNAK